jgi:DNA helicase-2/ATP-dependent DNA helicase PcrA
MWKKEVLKVPLLNLEITDDDIRALGRLDELTFDSERSRILKSLDTIDIQACPGSGKTTLIAAKLILLSQKWPHRNHGICVLSHTNVAKNEIINKIKNSNVSEARNLLSYPHFIGTIQEFVNRYLGIPYLRSCNIPVNLIDTERCVELIYFRLSHSTKTYIDTKSQYENPLFKFNLKMNGASIDMDVPTFPNGSSSDSFNNLKTTRTKLIREGYFFFRDFYVFADKILASNPSLSTILQERFPLVFMDEMQDTQKFQDELLQKIFPLDSTATAVQRFGDPDQAIFNGINDEVPNESYISKPRSGMSFVIDKSHRFDTSISRKIKGLSFNEVGLDTDLSEANLKKRNGCHSDGEQFRHTIFIYNDATIGQIIPEFAKLVASQFSDEVKKTAAFSVKAVGAVGKEIDGNGQLKIGHYWQGFDKSKSQKNFKENCFIEAVYFIRQKSEGDWSEGYKYLNDCVLRLLRLAGIKDEDGKSLTATSLKVLLMAKKDWHRYRRVLFWLMDHGNPLTDSKWQKVKTILTKIFGIKSTIAYLEYKQTLKQEKTEGTAIQNSPVLEGIRVELSTIHGVKGETHDATLILETKNYNHDVYAMLPYITGEKPNTANTNASLKTDPTNVKDIAKMPNQKFMRQLYVAMSRPRHLLCLAVHNDRITADQITLMQAPEKGWNIKRLQD